MPAKPNILILGVSGSGKTCSLEHLFVKHNSKVAFIDFERKGLPFLCDTTKLALYRECDTFAACDTALKDVRASDASIVVYDSFTALCEHIRDMAQAKYTGWDIWNAYNRQIRNFLEFNKNSGKTWIMTGIDEIVHVEQAEGSRASRIRLAVQGKQYEGKLEQQFTCVLYTTLKKQKDGSMKHVFVSQTDGIQPAKTPMWLQLPQECPNDVSLVVDKLIEKGLV